ncbi:MAG TPA: UDP-2,3-diacylglucosamine diphosphatase [Planctomycetota bacterium]
MSAAAAVLRAAPGAPPLDLGSVYTWIFTDLHLSTARPEEIAAFAATLEGAPGDLQALAILGDLFDAYLGPEHWHEPCFAVLTAGLARLAGRGVRVVLLRGNRDVLLEPADCGEFGLEVADGFLVAAGGRRWLVSHGDEYCLNDRPYQRLRRWLRRPWVRGTGRRLPRWLRCRAAAWLRGKSRKAVARKPLDVMALVEGAVEEALARYAAEIALIGHLHVEAERELPRGGALRILPAWCPERLPVVLGGPSAGPGA